MDADGEALPAEAWSVALLSLPGMGPARYRSLTVGREPAQAWAALTTGDPVTAPGLAPSVVDRWRRHARAHDVAAGWAALRRAGVGVARLGGAGFPAAFDADPEPPAVVFHRGAPSVLAGARVAIVGTRRCTRYGHDVARELGAQLAACGVGVVSGLALGIDAAAHRGALSVDGAPPIGVVGTGLDIVYPAANRDLWEAVAAQGLLLSESPLGSRAERWRFPARNRLLAAISDVVVVVESHQAGGSLHTVAEAAARDRPVMAVPGPIRSSASAGTNRLLSEGCAPVCSVDDILVALGLSPGRHRPSVDPARRASEVQVVVLDALGWQPVTFDQLADRCALDLGELAATVAELCELGWVQRHGGWLERVSTDRIAGTDRR